ncbi:MAG: glycosyltransferase family 4 protein [Desulfobacterales bacterium]|nr:glycosyltransferase family 4 protein [Desulfobacterales bacterium]
MLDVLALTSGRNVPSSRFRVRQYIAEMRRYDIAVREILPKVDKYADLPGALGHGRARRYLPPLYWAWAAYRLATRWPGVAQSRAARLVWLERELQPGFPTIEGLLGKPLVFDVDDAIWLKKPAGNRLARSIATRADTIIAGNAYIADWFSAWHKHIHIIPTAVDLRPFEAPAMLPAPAPPPFVIGWTGTSANFPYLYTIENALQRFLTHHPEARLCIIADRPPAFTRLPPHQLRFVAWRPQIETAALRSFSVGIMPLTDDAWSRGKCAFKMLQYLAAGLPVVVSPVGMNLEVMARLEGCGLPASNHSQWAEALDFIYHHQELARTWGAKGREVVRQHYSTPVIAGRLAAVFSRFR